MQMKNLEIRNLNEVAHSEDNVVEGYAVKFGTPSEDMGFIETIDRRAFDGVDLSDVRLFLQHDENKLLARTKSNTLKLTLDDVGLHFRALLPNTTLGKDTLEMVRRGDLSNCSFGFTVAKDSWSKKDGVNRRSIDKIKRMFEISLVSIPAYSDTDVALAKRSLQQAELDREKLSLEVELLGLV
jgi:HK97 family phage prohead protease